MQAYHYWKCYRKEGVTFQTAKLFSIEVDYYNFGTCEITDGAYFCGDHSCQTFKHIGYAGHGGQPTTTYEHISGDVLKKDGRWNDGTHLAPIAQRRVQKDYIGGPLRMDGYATQYYKHDSLKLSYATLCAYYAAYQCPYNRTIVQEDPSYPVLAAGDCRRQCDADPRCKMYMENKPESSRSPIDKMRCQLFTGAPWVSEVPESTNVEFSLVANFGWNTYVKISEAKPATWLHAPVQWKAPGLTSTRGALHVDSTEEFDVSQRDLHGRRLNNVY